MSIVRVGLAETRKFAQGYDAIFGKKAASSRKKRSKAKTTAAKKKAKRKR